MMRIFPLLLVVLLLVPPNLQGQHLLGPLYLRMLSVLQNRREGTEWPSIVCDTLCVWFQALILCIISFRRFHSAPSALQEAISASAKATASNRAHAARNPPKQHENCHHMLLRQTDDFLFVTTSEKCASDYKRVRASMFSNCENVLPMFLDFLGAFAGHACWLSGVWSFYQR